MILHDQWLPQSFVKITAEILKNGSVDNSTEVVEGIGYFGDELLSLLDGWYLSDDGTDVWEFKLTVENVGAIMPLEWGISWDEVDYDTLKRTTHTHTLTLPDAGPVSHTFTPAANHYSLSTNLNALDSFKCPA